GATGQIRGLFLRPQKPSQGGLDFPGRRQNLVLVGRDQFLGAGILKTDIVYDPAVVQDVPLELWHDGPEEALRVEQLGKILGLPAEHGIEEAEAGLEAARADLLL